MAAVSGTELLLIGGRSGAGKTSVASALHHLLSSARVRHALIEGDMLDLAWPPPWEHHLAERNLAAVWAGYRELGYRRLVYTNTVSVLAADELSAAMGDDPTVTAVLLTASDATAGARLARREHGDSLVAHVEHSAPAARRLEERAGAHVHRVATDDRPVQQIAAELAWLWLGDALPAAHR
nr:ATP-binding protein [Ruania albidiflava]